MREIKVKLFNKRTKEINYDIIKPRLMKYNNELILAEAFVSKDYKGTIEERRQNPNEWIMVLWTGLKDKNGKEIYEGDIFKYSIWEDKGVKKPVLYIVEWREKSASFGWKQIVPVLTEEFDLSEVEIIGNIYENPELLKEGG